MRENSPYPNLDLLFDGYLNQDYELFGEKIGDVLRVYCKEITPSMRQSAILEMEKFKASHIDDLEEAFELAYEREISIKSHGYTAESFFDELCRLLRG
ncbi:hypothetical protein FAZ95_24680 [Trinickia violacea]|uniref:CdiI immunity protein domain-containing protein n=1 Tax=Trinickia violacea TaxID=2571746 RepID=A0A4P8IT48_9BURK|nr:contact-dependent growth inhibition system immunity protein [Trinickia violacea]QCP52378.1 hypothetical protein FAZ95_24680 [Trinickia violacea]